MLNDDTTAALHEKGTEMMATPVRARTGLPVGDATDRPTGRRIGKGGILKGLCVAAVAALATGAAVAPASASTASARGCQGASAAAVLHADSGTYNYTCSGAHYISTYAYTFDAGGWSGAVYTNSWGPRYFCDGDRLTLSVLIYEVYLNATKPARCS
jgi:hypothetical protein